MKRIVRAREIFGYEERSSGGAGMILDGQRIDSIMRPPFPPELPSIDTGDDIIAPLLTDFHLHFFRKSLPEHELILFSLLRAGIGTVIEGGDRHMTGFEMREKLSDLIDVRCAGSAISFHGGYGSDIGDGVRTPDKAIELIDRLISLKVNYIKLVNSGIFLPETGSLSQGGWDIAWLTKIVWYAKERGLKVFCHANGDGAIRDAVLAGAETIIHGFFVSQETLSLMSDRGVCFVPTVAALAGLERIYYDSSVRQRLSETVDRHIEMVARAISTNVQVLPGSDSGASFLPHGDTFTEELSFLESAGMSVEDIIKASSGKPLAPGMRADFIVLDGLKIKKVFLKGECIFDTG